MKNKKSRPERPEAELPVNGIPSGEIKPNLKGALQAKLGGQRRGVVASDEVSEVAYSVHLRERGEGKGILFLPVFYHTEVSRGRETPRMGGRKKRLGGGGPSKEEFREGGILAELE